MNILKIILPMGLLGFLFVFIIKKLEKSEKIKGKNQNHKNKQNYLAEGMTIGMSFGIIFGSLYENIGTFLPIGMLIGLVVGQAIEKKEE